MPSKKEHDINRINKCYKEIQDFSKGTSIKKKEKKKREISL
jgi:hypothetical protein